MTKETYKFVLPEGLDPKAKDELFAMAEKLGVQFQQVAQNAPPSEQPIANITNPPLWSERTSGREVSPIDWIKKHYGNKDPNNWEAMNLSRSDLRNLDRSLYQAYASLISRHPNKDLKLPILTPVAFKNPEETLAHKRELVAAASRRYRAKKTMVNPL